jgi:hypothetical protein
MKEASKSRLWLQGRLQKKNQLLNQQKFTEVIEILIHLRQRLIIVLPLH